MSSIKLGRRYNKPDGTEGIATVNLTLQNESKVQIHGCVIHNKEELKKFINDYNYIQKYETKKYFVYFCYDQGKVLLDVFFADIEIHRFTQPDTPKTRKIDDFRNQVKVVDKYHIFLPLPIEYSKFPFDVQFLRDCSKNILITDKIHVADQECKGIEEGSKPLKFLCFKPSHQSIINNGVLELELSDDIFKKLIDNGPLLVQDKVIGWHTKIQDRKVISVHLLESKGEDDIQTGDCITDDSRAVENSSGSTQEQEPLLSIKETESQEDGSHDSDAGSIQDRKVISVHLLEAKAREVRVGELLNNINSLNDLAHCLDPEYTHILNWRHFAYILDVPEEVIRTYELYLVDSPSIKLFKHLRATKPELTILELKNALKTADIILELIKDYDSSDKVSDFLIETSTNILDQIALKLDSATRVLYGWKDLGKKLVVSRDTLKDFEMYRHNPTQQLLHYVCVSCEDDVPLTSYLKTMGREDILEKVKIITQLTDTNCISAKNVYKPGSQLLREICQHLNQDNVPGWRRLAKLLIDDKKIKDEDIISKLADPKQIHSPTKKIVEWIATNREKTTIQTLIEALQRNKRKDGVKILKNFLGGKEDIQTTLD